MARLGLTVPLAGSALAQQRRRLDDIEMVGYTDLWSLEASAADAFTPLVAAATSHPSFRLGTAIVSAYTRSPALMAMSIAALADVAEGEVALGIGASSDVIVSCWNGVDFRAPYQRGPGRGNLRAPGIERGKSRHDLRQLYDQGIPAGPHPAATAETADRCAATRDAQARGQHFRRSDRQLAVRR